MPIRTDEFRAFFESTADEFKPVVTELRAMVRKTAPRLVELMRYGMPSYVAVDGAKKPTVVYIMPASDHVNLGFYDGVDLRDPGELLDGTGKRLRHVKVYSLKEAKNPRSAPS